MHRSAGETVSIAKLFAVISALSLALGSGAATAQEAESDTAAPAAGGAAEERGAGAMGDVQDPAYDPGILNTIGDTSTSMPLGEEQAEVEAADPALMQELSPSETKEVEEIVVSARKRQELLEDTPVAVSVVTPTELLEAGITNITQLDQVVPNLQVINTGAGAAFVIRGIGAFPAPYFDQGVGLYVDGVYIPRQQGNITEMVDIQQIEVLRGPQGTLFGKNSAGGAVKITTAPPTTETEAFARVRYTTNDYIQTRTTLNFPAPIAALEDDLAFRLNFATTNFGGTVTVEDYLRPSAEVPEPQKIGEHRGGNQNNLNFLGSMRYTPLENLIIDVSGMWNRNWSRGGSGRCIRLQVSEYEAVMNDIPHPDNPYTSEDYYGPDDIEAYRNSDGGACGQSQPYLTRNDTPGVSSQTTAMAWATALWDVGDAGVFEDLQLKLLSSWRDFQTYGRTDGDGTQYWVTELDSTGGSAIGGEPTTGWSITEEVQVNASAVDNRLNFVAGLFGFMESVSEEGLLRVLPGTIADANGGTTVGSFTTNNWDWSIYGQGDFSVTDWFQVIAGIRFAQEKKGIDRLRVQPASPDDSFGFPGPVECQPGTGGSTGTACEFVQGPNNLVPNSGDCAPGTGPQPIVNPATGEPMLNPATGQTMLGPGDLPCDPVGWTARKTFTNWSPMASIKFTLPDEFLDDFWLQHVMTYFQYARGYKGGGFNGGALDDDPRQRSGFGPEYNDSFELGLKTIQFEDRFQFSLALFLSSYQDLQLPAVETFEPPPGCQPQPGSGLEECIPTTVTLIRNVPKSTVKGFEIEMKVRPLPFLQIDWELGYQDARLDDFPNAENPLTGQEYNASGQRFSFVPALNSHLAVSTPLPVDFDFLPDFMSGIVQPRIDWTHRSPIQWFSPKLNESIYNPDAGIQPTLDLLNFRVSYFFNDNQTQFALFGENLLDQKQMVTFVGTGARVLGSGLQFFGLGAAFGVEVSHTF